MVGLSITVCTLGNKGACGLNPTQGCAGKSWRRRSVSFTMSSEPVCFAQNMVIMEYAAGGTLSCKLATDGVGGQPRRFGWCAPALRC